MNRRKRTLIIVSVLLAVLLPPVWITYREWRQARLDYALIAAIKAGDDNKALEALAEGASGEARDTGEPPTFKEALLRLWDHFRHREQQKAEPEYTPVILLLYQKKWIKGRIVLYQILFPRLSVVRALLDHGANVNDRDKYGASLLHHAAEFSDDDLMKLLLERRADANLADSAGDTPLMKASDAKTIEMLVEHGANINAIDLDRRTALMWAIGQGKVDVVRTLLEHGAKVGVTDSDGRTALNYVSDIHAINENDPEPPKIIALLRQYGAK